jgi:hypothetical protein
MRGLLWWVTVIYYSPNLDQKFVNYSLNLWLFSVNFQIFYKLENSHWAKSKYRELACENSLNQLHQFEANDEYFTRSSKFKIIDIVENFNSNNAVFMIMIAYAIKLKNLSDSFFWLISGPQFGAYGIEGNFYRLK